MCEMIVEKNQTNCVKEYKENITNSENNVKQAEYEKSMKYNKRLIGENVDDEKIKYEDILNLSKNGIMSYIVIPKISVNLPIYHGTENEQMKKGVRSY